METLSLETLRQRGHDRFVIADEADIGALRRAVGRFAERLRPGSGNGRGLAELVAAELGTNLLRHAQPGGWVLARPVPPAGIELIAVDRGPGIAELPAAPPAGRTPGRPGLGSGLAAVRRAASSFDLHTEPGAGTAVAVVVDLDGAAARAPRSWAGISVGITEVCGDGWAVAELDDGLVVAVVDGLGHGPKASVAADAALAACAADPGDLVGFPGRANAAMRATRGGAVAVCRIHPDRGELHHVAIGNVNGRVVAGGEQRGLAFHSGTLGLSATPRRATPSSYPWPPGATLVLWTDGLGSRIDLSTMDDVLTHDPAVVAATLHRDHSRDRDDATVVVVRHPERP